VRKRINVVRNETSKSRSHVSKMGFVVVPSVSDGVLNLPARRERALHRNRCPKCVRRRIPVVCNETPKSRSHMSKMGFVVVPSVSDGLTQGMSRMSKMCEKTNKRCAQRASKVSESCVQNGFCCSAVRLRRGFKSSLSEMALHRNRCPKWVRRRITVVRNETPKCRSCLKKVPQASCL